jgi:CheY-like chemotaxis protein
MGGPEAYDRIRQLDGDVPLIFMTGYSSDLVKSRFVKQNISLEALEAAVVQKPYNIEGLGRKIREVLDASRSAATSENRPNRPTVANDLVADALRADVLRREKLS